MANNFEERIKNMEREVLDLKTASLFTSIRNVTVTHSGTVYTGVYKITYESSDEPIMSFFYSDKYKKSEGSIKPRTPSGSTQYVEVDTTYAVIEQGGATPVTYNISFSVVSNIPVKSIVRQ